MTQAPLQYLRADDTAPANSGVAIVAADADLALTPTRALYVGNGGDVSVVFAPGSTPVIFPNVQAGTILPVRVTQVRATGTTATGIVGMY